MEKGEVEEAKKNLVTVTGDWTHELCLQSRVHTNYLK